MKKNVILFVIDSLNNTRVKEYGNILMPYLSTLKSKYCFCDNMYSQAPYTEAAVMNLYCGQDVLANNGYLYRFKDAPEVMFEKFKELGYSTYYNSFQPQCFPSSLRRGVDHLYYNVGFDIEALWSYRLYHYADLLHSGNINKEDYRVISLIMRDNFEEWLIFLDALLNDEPEIGMIRHNVNNYDVDKIRTLVQNEYLTFQSNELVYINNLLNAGKTHIIFNISSFFQDRKVKSSETKRYVSKQSEHLIRDIRFINLKRNIKSIPYLTGMLVNGFFKMLFKRGFCKKDFLKMVYYSLNHILDFDLTDRFKPDYDTFKNAPSARTHIDHFLEWKNNREDKDSPYFACIHVDDVHNPEVFFTYDTDEKNILEYEFNEVGNLLKEMPNKMQGSVTHDLSLKYIDNVIKYLVENVNKNDGNETSIVICADHGFSFCGSPIRDTYVTNLYLENYNIPFVVIDEDYKNIEIKGLRSSKDIPSVLYHLTENTFESYLSNKGNDYAYIMYCGGGCPDIKRRELKLAVFNKTYFVGTLCKIDEELTIDKVTEIYDLKMDPLQKRNLVGRKFDYEEVVTMLKLINEKREEIVL